MLTENKFEALGEMTHEFLQADFFKQEFRILLNTLVACLTQEVHRHLLETSMVGLLERFVGIGSQDEAKENFTEYTNNFINQKPETPFSEEIFQRLDQVNELGEFEECLEELSAAVADTQILAEVPSENSKKNNSSKGVKKKKFESLYLQESAQSGFIKTLEDSLSHQMQKRVARLFELFLQKGRRMVELRDHQVRIAQQIADGFRAAEKETVDMLTNFLGRF